ncbi:MAG: DUF5057 domain-containing protein [Lachnospiraceae bacterium]|nr:DUF5057 domain-containing protein [Lachnospiraceae bacterium]
MKKAGKFVAWLLVLTLTTSLMAGVGFKAETVNAADKSFTVLEIVPDATQATFGYFVKSWTDANRTEVVTNCLANSGALNTFLKSAGCGEVQGSSFVSNDYFVNNVLKKIDDSANWNVNVVTKTPADLNANSSIISSADFIVINETVPQVFKNISGVNHAVTFSTNGHKLNPDTVLKIFKKIAGVEGETPVPYIIDFNLYDSSSFSDIRTKDPIFTFFPDGTSGYFGSVKADYIYKLEQGQGAAGTVTPGSNSSLYQGTDSTSFKLYKLLSCIDPATLYGLYFTETDGSHGVDDDLNIIGNGPDDKGNNGNHSAGEVSTYNLNTKLQTWCDEVFRPLYLVSDATDIGSIMSKMGWFEYGTTTGDNGNGKKQAQAEGYKVIGGADGRGIVYNSNKGLFYVFSKLTENSGSSGPAVSVSYKFNADWSGASTGGGTLSIKNNGSDPITLASVEAIISDFESISFYSGTNNCTFDKNTGLLKFETNETINGGGKVDFNGGWKALTNGYSVNQNIDADKYTVTLAAGADPTEKQKLKNMIGSFLATEPKNDYHPYRFLVVADNHNLGSVNRSVIADMVNVANASGKGLAGGIVVECMSKYEFDNITVNLNQTYDGICVENGSFSSDHSVGSSKYSSYSGIKASFSKDSLKSAFSSILSSSSTFGLDYISVPTEYYTNFRARFSGENGSLGYLGASGDTYVKDNVNYINDDNHSGKRTLDFKFYIKGSGTYDIDLYIDVDGDCRFEDNEKVDVASASGNSQTPHESSTSLDEFYGSDAGKDFVGGFAWKLVVSNSSKSICRTGYSAIRNEKDTNTIRILQIYPTAYKNDDTSNSTSEDNPNPILLLPDASELEGVKGITSISGDTLSGINTLKSYFSGKIKLDMANSLGIMSPYSSTLSDVTLNTTTSREKIIMNSSLFYYYLTKLGYYNDGAFKQAYAVDVKRLSVYSFNQAMAKGEFVYNKETGRIGPAEGDQILNLDGSLRWGYTYDKLGLGSDWKTKTVTWTEGILSKYLVDESTGLIYGLREETDGKVSYYGSTANGKAGTAIKGSNTDKEFDMVMIGFGGTLDYMYPAGVELLTKYIKNKGPVFIGGGTISNATNNNFGKEIREIIGMSATKTGSYNYVYETVNGLMETNDTLFSHFPYRVNAIMKGTVESVAIHKLDLSGDNAPVVAFTKYNSGDSSSTYGKWGYAENNYYVYKKENITYCGFGPAYQKSGLDQVGGVMPMAETLMIVNALIAASRYGSGGITVDPFIDCIDPDRSVLDVTNMEDDYSGSYYMFKDAVYTDYDSYDIAKYTNNIISSVSPIESIALKPGKSEDGFTDTGLSVRWIPYKAKMAVEEGASIVFYTSDNKNIGANSSGDPIIGVYQYKNGKFNKLSLTTTSTGEKGYVLTSKGTYYIGVPINTGAYSNVTTSSKVGFALDKTSSNETDQFAIKFNLINDAKKIAEAHTIMMVRRVIYHDR